MERGSLHYHMEIDAALLYVQKKSSSSRIMSGKRRAGNPSNCSSNCNDSSNGFHHHHHHHHHRGLGNMPSKREMENLPVLDLHGCFKQDAKRKVTDFLEQQQRAQTNKSSCSNHNGQGRLCKIITGTGAHSSATGGPILKTAVENLLTKRQMHFDCKTIPGAFIVDAATGIVLESRACTATDTKIVLAHAEDEAVVLQRAAQQQGKRRAAASASAHARSNNRLSSSHETNNNNLLNGPSVSEVALADKALEWAQVESRKVQQQQHHLAKSDAKQVERAIDISLREHSSSHMDDDDDDDDVAWQEEFERALKISQQETTMTPDNVQERIKQALQESARLEAERIEMEKRELLELEMALQLSQECSSSTATTAFKTDELVEQDDEDLELERALRESARQQELEAAMRLAPQQQAAAEARVVRDRERQLKLETRATMERQRALEKQIALEQRQRAALEKQELEKQALDRQHELERQRQIALEKKQASALAWQQELEKQAALAWQLASALRIQATVRGYQCRRMTCIMKTRILAATVLLQAYWRRGLTLAIHQHQKRAAAAAASTAATLIQSVTRSYQCRRLLLVSQAAEKETARNRRLDEEENEKLAMALQKEENEKVATAFAFHMCVEEVDEDQKQLGIAMSLSQQETEKQRALPPPCAAACHEWHKAVFKKQSEVEKQATSEWQKVQEDLERQAACIGQRYFCAHCNCHHGTEEEEEEEKLALKEAPLESKESREQLKQAPENSSQSSPALSRRDCVDKTEEEESMNQQGSTSKPPPTAPTAVTISKPQSSSQLKPTPTPAAPTTTQGVQGGVEDSKRRAVLNNSTKQSPGEATRQEETPGRAAEQQAPRVEDASSSSGYAMQFPERRESAKSKKDTEDLDQAILEASRSKDANFLADFLSRSF
jgi:Smr domain/IQ calmodulin-binding motif